MISYLSHIWRSYLNTDMCKFDSSQNGESRAQSAYSKPRAFHCVNFSGYFCFPAIRTWRRRVLIIPVFSLLLIVSDLMPLRKRRALPDRKRDLLLIATGLPFYS